MLRPLPRPTLFPYTTLFRSRSMTSQPSVAASYRPRPGALGSLVGQKAVMADERAEGARAGAGRGDRKSTRLNSSHTVISYAVFCLKKKKQNKTRSHADQ